MMSYDDKQIAGSQLCLSTFLITAKRHVRVSNVSNDELLNALLKPVVEAGNITNKNGEILYMDTGRTSLIINRKSDVPEAVRRAFNRSGVEEKAAANFARFARVNIDADRMEDFASDIAGIISADHSMPDGQKNSLLEPREEPYAFLGAAYVAALKANNILVQEDTIWCRGTGNIAYAVGDLFSYGFKNRKKRKNIVVIPVNTAFDTKVDHACEGNPHPLVSAATIHGQWLMRLEDAGCTIDELPARIASDIANQGVEPIGLDAYSGEKPEYPIGTVAVIEHGKATYFLLAISTFDENNNAQSTREQIASALESLLRAYDQRGQGLDIYLPLMGTGNSRANLTHQESFDLTMEILERDSAKIHGKVTVVVYKDDVDKVNQLR